MKNVSFQLKNKSETFYSSHERFDGSTKFEFQSTRKLSIFSTATGVVCVYFRGGEKQ